jgi:hypothetical protein
LHGRGTCLRVAEAHLDDSPHGDDPSAPRAGCNSAHRSLDPVRVSRRPIGQAALINCVWPCPLGAGQLAETSHRLREVDILLGSSACSKVPSTVGCPDRVPKGSQAFERLVCSRAGKRQTGSREDPLDDSVLRGRGGEPKRRGLKTPPWLPARYRARSRAVVPRCEGQTGAVVRSAANEASTLYLRARSASGAAHGGDGAAGISKSDRIEP